jgi:Glycosyltransferase family 25 (LPS biosynthesis protein)
MNAYVINLERAVERREHMEAQLEGLAYEFVDAGDGHALTEDQRAALDFPRWLTPGGLGRALSHRKAYRRILEAGEPFGLVLEDDAVVPSVLPALVEQLPSLLGSAEIALLHYRTTQPGRLGDGPSRARDFRLRQALDAKWLNATTGYVIGREACERMLDLHPVVMAPDGWGDFLDAQVIDRVWCVHPQPVRARTDLESTTGYRNWWILPKWLRAWNRERIQRRMTDFEIVSP